ncbi:TetR/AcrR family transcriptional regulator [Loigolactobacillus binensis]|uniref:TetR/AcrR family transcriptional regulator n=1 Tax=Loigolactobacillus binensis TaxID=2559922 RepID=A0ABW3ED23_9LACO|nr:TetR/AcrR family transcriptional regulator [Loigolactobacillus binensis]
MAATQHAQQIKQDSQDYLTTALFQLLQKKELDQIKVAELIKRAGVSRMAFYRNYHSLAEILEQYFAPHIQRLFNDVIIAVPSAAKITDMTAFFDHFAAELRLAATRNYEYIIRQLFYDNMVRYYDAGTAWQGISATKRRYWVTFMSAGVYAIWREWLLNRQKETLAQMHELIGQLQNATAAAMIAPK